MAPNVSHAQKIALLRQMIERRTLLFAGFDGQTTAISIGEAWESLWQWCISNGYPFCSGARGWEYFRQNTWPNWKRLAIVRFAVFNSENKFQERHDKSMLTGGGGYEPTPSDDLILQIVGKNSPLLAEIADKREGERAPAPATSHKRGVAHALNGSSSSVVVLEQAPPRPLDITSSSLALKTEVCLCACVCKHGCQC